MNELDPLRRRVRVLEDQFRNLMVGEGWSVGTFQDEGVPGHWEFRYPKKQQGEGACCFPDGSCTVLTKTDCYDQGGSFLANGTTCSPNPCSGFCVGACCQDDGSCTVERQSTCEASGGTWQGCGTDCDPNPCPPTGACCIDTTCSITTESDCTGMGGTYQGDGTTCDPDPCTMPPCCENAFSHGGHFYHTKTVHFVGSDTFDDHLGNTCTGNDDITTTQTIDPMTCVLTKTCSGSGTKTVNGVETDYTWILLGSGDCGFHTGAGDTSDPCEAFRCVATYSCPTAPAGDCPGGIIDDLTDDCSGSASDSTHSASWNVTVTYSDECTP